MNSIPIVGWLIDLLFKVSTAVPFWIVWTKCGIGAEFFYFLPEVYLRPGFWAIVGVFICLGILAGFSPFKVSSSSSADRKES